MCLTPHSTAGESRQFKVSPYLVAFKDSSCCRVIFLVSLLFLGLCKQNVSALRPNLPRCPLLYKVLEKLCAVLAQASGGGGGGGGDVDSEGRRAMAAVLLRALFDAPSDFWFRIQERTRIGGDCVFLWNRRRLEVCMQLKCIIMVCSFIELRKTKESI